MNLNFNDGYQSFEINGDPERVIKINPTDFGILERLNGAQKKIDALAERGKKQNVTPEILTECDKEMRKIIDYVFAAKISDTAFGSVNCLSVAGGACVFENFMNALIPVIEKNAKVEAQKSRKRVEHYTKRVT